MACSSLSFPVTAKKSSSHAKSSPSSAVAAAAAAAAVSPSSSLHSSSSRSNQCSQLFLSSSRPSLSLRCDLNLIPRRLSRKPPNFLVVSSLGNKPEPLKAMISGAPASGKGTQCELISKKYGLVHIAAGDLLRAEVSAGSENGKRAKEFMEKGQLVPDEIVVMMVKDRLSQSDSQENGWLLDGYPRSLSQATALKGFGFQPDIFILLEVSEDNLVERVVGRRLDPVTGRIYHLKYSPPETKEIAARLTQRFDDTEEKVKLRLQTHHRNVESVLSMYEDITVRVNGNDSKDDVFAQIDIELKKLVEQKKATSGSVAACFKLLEFLGFLLHGPNQPLIELASSMAALKENPLSILGSSLEKFQLPLNQLNSLIKITLEVIKYICELTLLSDTEYIIEDLLSTGVHSAVLSLVACYIQITLLMQNGEVALELSHLISSLGYILNDIKHQYINCKPQMEEMEAHMQSNALFEDILKTRIEISELMKSFTYSKDGHQSVIDGSTMSKVDLEVLKEKSILFFISDLDISTEEISRLLKIYEEIREEDYYKVVWVPFVLRWTEELRQKFENLKSKMPWYVVCYDSPVAGLWYIKGRWFSTHNPSFVLIDQRDGEQYVIYPPNEKEYQVKFRLYIVEEKSFPFKRLEVNLSAVLSAPPRLPQLYSIHTAGAQQNNPSSGFAGLLSKSKNTTGKKHEGDIPVHTPKVT